MPTLQKSYENCENMEHLEKCQARLKRMLENCGRVGIAVSGGVDSAYLLYAASRYCGKVKAYFIKTAFQPGFELADAMRVAAQFGVELKLIEKDILSDDLVASNPKERCYYCKRALFSALIEEAKRDGLETVFDGTNASDDEGDRPGIRALKELSVRSPLKECGLTKSDIRLLSKQAGLFTWDKPSYACLATRIPSGIRITLDLLEKTEKAEQYLASLGFSDFRVRLVDDSAKIQLRSEQFGLLMRNREKILNELEKYYGAVTLDLRSRE